MRVRVVMRSFRCVAAEVRALPPYPRSVSLSPGRGG
jgi:hypothetical protein